MSDFSPQDVEQMDDLSLVFGTTKFLPRVADIPDKFWKECDPYNKTARWMFGGYNLLTGYEISPAYEQLVKNGRFHRFIVAHLRSYEPKHEHKIAGVAMMLAHVLRIPEAS